MVDADQPAGHGFEGLSFTISAFGNGQIIKIVYSKQQLLETMYPAFKAAFRQHGFDDVPWKDLLYVLTVGGEIDLRGKRFINRETYSPLTMERLFMKRERALVFELMTIVFNTAENVANMRGIAPFREVATSLQFDASVALRKTTLVYHALGECLEDTFRIIIEGEGTGENLRIHRFKFQPSRRWHCQRYPENV
jgi:hypothetical protein